MAMQTSRGFLYPSALLSDTSNNLVASSSIAAAASGDKVAYMIESPVAGVLTAIRIRQGGNTTSGNADVRVETVDLTTAQATPTGTLVGTNANVTVTFNAANTYFTATLTTGPTLTRGQNIAIVIVNSTGNYTFSATIANAAGFPYIMHFASAAWTVDTTRTPVLALNFSGTWYYVPGTQYIGSTVSIASNTTPDEVGNKFTLPVGMRVGGFGLGMDMDGDTDVVLYDASSNALLTRSLDKDHRVNTTAMGQLRKFTSTYDCLANTTYRLVAKPSSTTAGTLGYWVVGSSAELGAMPGGTDFQYTSRTDAGAWTDTNTQQAMIFPWIEGIDLPGGLMVGVGMDGGLTT